MSIAVPDAHSATIIPAGVDPATVSIGYLYDGLVVDPDSGIISAINSTEVFADAVDVSFGYTVPEGRFFMPGFSAYYANVQYFNPFFSGGSFDTAAFIAAVNRFSVGPGLVDTSNWVFVDLTSANAAAIASIGETNEFIINLYIPTGPRLTDQNSFDAHVQSVVEFAEGQFALQPDDPGLLETLDSLPTTYSPSSVPEPSASLLGLLGTALLFRRRRAS